MEEQINKLYKKRFQLCLKLLGLKGKEYILYKIMYNAGEDEYKARRAIVRTANEMYPNKVPFKRYLFFRNSEDDCIREEYDATHIIDGYFDVEYTQSHRICELGWGVDKKEDFLMTEQEFLDKMNTIGFNEEL